LIVLSTRFEEPWFTVSCELKRVLLDMGFDVYNPNTDCVKLYRAGRSRYSWTDIWLLTFAEKLDQAEATQGFIVQVQELEGDSCEKSCMHRAEEKLGRRWAVPIIGIPVWSYWPTYRTDLHPPSCLAAALADHAWTLGITNTLIECHGIYQGGVENGCRHGYGEEWCSSGSVFQGEFFDGLRNGYGFDIFPNGHVFEGQFWDGVRQGPGRETDANGFVREKVHAQERLRGFVIELSYSDGFFHGEYLAGRRQPTLALLDAARNGLSSADAIQRPPSCSLEFSDPGDGDESQCDATGLHRKQSSPLPDSFDGVFPSLYILQ